MTHSVPRIESVNVGVLCVLPGVRNAQPTGIVKRPVAGPVRVDRDGLEGDHIGSVRDHGGPDQAVYVFSSEDYAWWEESLQRRLEPGIFGENLTVSGWDPVAARVGDLWEIDGLRLELSGPRIPCATLAARMGIPTLVKRFAQANRGGAYARVLHPGTVWAGAAVEVVQAGEENPKIHELFALWHQKEKSLELIRRALASPVAWRARIDLERWRSRLEGAGRCG
ncbi:hypothetical protein ABS71_10220 [bacterium SCN 62-11]|mgnify:CR=1 FL=1|nr:MOSC domain-containing protein [Candidatus Eremiobacteraeota bacterium]ODT67895.1 MAG: hypothetical protein ABS71_10220 [bacterium SCN 62-11]